MPRRRRLHPGEPLATCSLQFGLRRRDGALALTKLSETVGDLRLAIAEPTRDLRGVAALAPQPQDGGIFGAGAV
jgi:hypothetical protein